MQLSLMWHHDTLGEKEIVIIDKLNNIHLLCFYAPYRSCREIYVLHHLHKTYKPESSRYAVITLQSILIHTIQYNENLFHCEITQQLGKGYPQSEKISSEKKKDETSSSHR